MLSRLPRVSFGTQVLIGLVLGIALGLVARSTGASADNPTWLSETMRIVGSSFVTLLRTIVPPLVFLAIVSSIANLQQVANAARLAWQTLLWFAVTALASVAIGITVGLLLDPARGAGVTAADAAEPSRTGGWLDFLTGIIPANMLGLSASTGRDDSISLSFNVLQILVLAIAVGIAVVKVGKEAEPFLGFARSALAVVQKVLWWIIRLAPLATVGLLGNAIVAYGWDTIGSLGRFTLAVYVGLLLVVAVLYPLVLRLNGLSVRQFFSGAWPAIQLGFVSRSSIGTMPVTQAVTERNLGVPRAYSSFAVPLGATTKMDGCAAIYPAIAAIFVAEFFGIQLGLTEYLLIAFVAVIGSAATAGVTGATVMLTLTLSTLGLPLEGVGLLLAVDPILDMGRTATNVAGQSLVAAVVAKREGILDQAAYDAPRRGLPWATDTPEAGSAGDTAAAQPVTVDAAQGQAPEAADEARHPQDARSGARTSAETDTARR